MKFRLIIANVIGFLVANPLFIYLIIGFIIFVGIFSTFQSCRNKDGINTEKLDKQIEKQREKRENELQNTLDNSDQRIKEIDSEVKKAEEKTANVRKTKAKGTTGEELDKLAEKER